MTNMDYTCMDPYIVRFGGDRDLSADERRVKDVQGKVHTKPTTTLAIAKAARANKM
jgi:predicted GTPase